jgi:hypothetical protein
MDEAEYTSLRETFVCSVLRSSALLHFNDAIAYEADNAMTLALRKSWRRHSAESRISNAIKQEIRPALAIDFKSAQAPLPSPVQTRKPAWIGRQREISSGLDSIARAELSSLFLLDSSRIEGPSSKNHLVSTPKALLLVLIATALLLTGYQRFVLEPELEELVNILTENAGTK